FAFQSERSQVLVGDGIVGQVLRRVADDDGARFGDRLVAGGGVDYVTQDQPLIVSSRPDCRLAGGHADTQPEVGDADLLTEGRHFVHQFEAGSYRAFGIVGLGPLRTRKDRDRLARELVDFTSGAVDDAAATIEVGSQEGWASLRVQALRNRREGCEVTEE